MRLSRLLFTAATMLVMATGYATDDPLPNDEGPFVDGVFSSRLAGSTVPPTNSTLGEIDSPVPLLFDHDGNSNEVIIALDYRNPILVTMAVPTLATERARDVIETTVVSALQKRDVLASKAFLGAAYGRLLTSGMRLHPEIRGLLGTNHPRERLEQYIVLRYRTVEEAENALASLKRAPGIAYATQNVRMDFSWAPNDPYFPINPAAAGYYQWGMHAMNFSSAWDVTKGHGYVAAIDTAFLNNLVPTDLLANYRSQFSFILAALPSDRPALPFHGTHVVGIIGATANNATGVSGGCPTCSVAIIQHGTAIAATAPAFVKAVEMGIHVVNLSSTNNLTCATAQPVCDAIAFADSRDALIVAAAGNFASQTGPGFPADQPSVLSVAGAQNVTPSVPTSWLFWTGSGTDGSNFAGLNGVTAPAKSIVSTVPVGIQYSPDPLFRCSDLLPVDESGIASDGYGSCTGTSMATPHVSALAGILRSINPRLSKDSIKTIIRQTASHAGAPTAQLGSGMPNARAAVDRALYLTPTNRLTPLFSFYSSARLDYFYTTLPQMGTAALFGTLEPRRPQAPDNNHYVQSARYYPAGLNTINFYGIFPGHPPDAAAPRADAWVFTTPENPKSTTIPLAPLYRLSWKCGDTVQMPPCDTNPEHTDTVYTADVNGITAYQGVGYKLDGIEGYIYPKTVAQPLGTQRLMRKYNPARDDHTIFPESMLSTMTAQGYTQNSGSSWLGYVYPNLTGNSPTIQ